MIISFSGRKNSGKTTLAKILMQRGFQKISFADKLKELVSEIYSWPLTELSDSIKKEEKLDPPVQWGKNEAQVLERLINSHSKLDSTPRTFYTRRQSLQYIGTEVLRKYDNDFHVKSVRNKIKLGNDYVLDDVRFPNELEELNNLDAITIFILRPYYFDDYSNHTSETNINYTMINNVIVNDGSLHKFLRKSKMFLESVLSSRTPVISKKKLYQLLEDLNYDTSKTAEVLKCSRDKIIWWATKNLIYIPRNIYKHEHSVFSTPNPESAYWAGLLSADGCIKKHLKHGFLLELSSDDFNLVEGFKKFVQSNKPICSKTRSNGKTGHTFIMSCPFIIEDLKLWCVEPRKSKYNKIPDLIRDDKELLKYWLIGLIDGDGSIHPQGNSICICFVASKEIVDFVYDTFDSSGKIYSEKEIDNLYCLKYYGNNAIDFYYEIYKPSFGLDRKWKKMEDFILNKKKSMGEPQYGGRTQRQNNY